LALAVLLVVQVLSEQEVQVVSEVTMQSVVAVEAQAVETLEALVVQAGQVEAVQNLMVTLVLGVLEYQDKEITEQPVTEVAEAVVEVQVVLEVLVMAGLEQALTLLEPQ
jgi:hypothetical protein